MPWNGCYVTYDLTSGGRRPPAGRPPPERANVDYALGHPTIAEQEFDRYSQALEAENAFEQIQIAHVMKRRYERQRGGSGRVDEAPMGADCAVKA